MFQTDNEMHIYMHWIIERYKSYKYRNKCYGFYIKLDKYNII